MKRVRPTINRVLAWLLTFILAFGGLGVTPQAHAMEGGKTILTVDDPGMIYITAGEMPSLPTDLSVNYDDGTSGREAVSWDTAGIDFSEPGEYQVPGQITGYSETVHQTVQVAGLASITAAADTYVQDSASPTVNAEYIHLKKDAAGYNRKGYVRFDLTGLERGAACYTLDMEVVSSGDYNMGPQFRELKVYTTMDWVAESGLSWDAAPARKSETPAGALAREAIPESKRVEIDVTGAVRAALEAGETSLSFELSNQEQVKNDGEQTTIAFYSLENSQGRQGPALTAHSQAAAEKIKVACVGDSITFGSTYAVPSLKKNYPTRLQELLGEGYLVRNFGVSGACMLKNASESKGYDKQAEYAASLAFEPDIVVIMLGTNDAKAVNWDANKDSFASDAKALIDAYRGLPTDPEIYIATSPTVLGANAYHVQANVVHDEIVPLQREIAQENGCHLIDVHDGTKDATTALLPDNVHGNDDGYDLIANIIYNGITDQYVVERNITGLEDCQISIPAGGQLTAPTTVTAHYDRGASGPVPVTWDAAVLSAVNVNIPDKTIVTGTVEGYEGTVTLTVIVTAAADPVSLAPVVDRTIQKNNADLSTAVDLRVKWANGDAYVRMVLLQFSLESMSGAELAQMEARLKLYAKNVEGLFASDDGAWLYATATAPANQNWSTVEALCTEENKVRQITAHTTNTWLELDVTDAVKAAKAGGADQITFILKNTKYSTGGTNGMEFHSTRYSNAELHPHLLLNRAPAITEINPVYREAATGTVPDLPARVDARLDNGETRSVAVTWNMAGLSFDEVGTVTVTGAVEGTELTATAYVTVKRSNELAPSLYQTAADIYVQAGTHSDLTPQRYGASNTPAFLPEKLRLKNSNNSGTQEYTRRIYLLFDLAGVEPGFQQAQILLHVTDDAKNPEAGFAGGDIYVLTGAPQASDFGADTITWNSAPGHEEEKYDSFTASSVVDGVAYLDVTRAVEEAKAAGKSTVGFMLTIPTTGTENGVNFHSSRSADPDKRPALRTTGLLISEIPEVTLTTEIGVAPRLPATVPVSLYAGGSRQEAVTWESVDEASYAGVGVFTVRGSLDDYFNMEVTAKVTVTPPEGYTGTVYYVDATGGSDASSGTSPAAAWQTLDAVNRHAAFLPGDQILLKKGETWNGYLRPRGSGLPDSPITIGSYGEGDARPILNGGGTTYAKYSATLMLYNQSHWVVDGLEITNFGAGEAAGQRFSGYARAGIYVFTCDQSKLVEGIEVKNCFVHDVVSNTSDSLAGTSPKMTGGIIVLAEYRDIDGNSVLAEAGIAENKNHRAGFRDVELHHNVVLRTMHEGIRTKVEGTWGPADGYPRNASDVHIHNNYIEKTLGDGIVVGESNGGIVVERNVVKDAAYWNINSVYYAAAWVHYADDTLFQYNEVYGTRYGQGDGEAFDADNYCDGTIFQYNYTHDNWGGSCLFMASQTNTVYRYNISANDGTRSTEEILNDHSTNTAVLNATVPNVYNNTFYIDKNSGTRLYGSTKANAFVNFRNNIIATADDTKTLIFVKGTSPPHPLFKTISSPTRGFLPAKCPTTRRRCGPTTISLGIPSCGTRRLRPTMTASALITWAWRGLRR